MNLIELIMHYTKQIKREALRRACRMSVAAMLASAAAASCFAQADTAQDIGVQEQLRQQQRQDALRKQQESTPDVRLQPPAALGASDFLPRQEKPCFPIHRLELTGQDAARFNAALQAADFTGSREYDPVVGHCLGTAGINVVLARVQNAIVEQGFVTTRVMAEPQNLADGTLTLTILPGRVRAIRLIAGGTRATLWNALPLKAGDLINLRDIEQALENFERVPTVQADVQIVPAEGPQARPGESDLLIQWAQKRLFRFTASADDGGSKATGKYQGGLTVSYDDWWTLNDLFYVSFGRDLGGGEAGDRGTRNKSLHYSVPFGYWQLAWNANDSAYHQSVAGASQTYVYSGTSSNSDIRLSRLIYRDAIHKLTVFGGGWLRSSRNSIDDTEIEVQRRRMAGWQAGVSHRAAWPQATFSANLTYRRGTGAMGALRAPEEAFDEGSSRPRLVTAELQLLRPIKVADAVLHYTATWRGQWNQTPLVPQDRFAIGGRYTVRGFDGELSLSGEQGWLLRNEFAFALGATGQELYMALDHGQVAGASTAALVGSRLTGAALGLRGGHEGLYYDVFWSKPVDRPRGFQTADSSTGFNLVWSY